MIPVHKKKEMIAFIEKLEDENVLAQIQALLVRAKSAVPAAPASPVADEKETATATPPTE